MNVRDVMSAPVVTVRGNAPYKKLVETMLANGVSSLPVVDDDGVLIGIVSESDLLPREARFRDKPQVEHRDLISAFLDLLSGEPWWMRKAAASDAAALMTRHVSTAQPEEPLRLVARRMVSAGRKHVPVVDDSNRVVGMLSRSDVLRIFAIPDVELEDAVREQLNRSGFEPPDAVIDIRVNDGVVHLDGAVERASDVPVITGVLRWVEGIIDIEPALSFGRDDKERA